LEKFTVKTSDVQPLQFNPFTLTLTFETPDDVAEFWHRLNISTGAIMRNYGRKPILAFASSKIVWYILKNVVKQYKIPLWEDER
jgi:hypothetical protein